MDPNDFLAFALELATPATNNAAKYRSAVSRAYYAAFHIALQFLAKQSFYCRDRNGNEHKWAQMVLQNTNVPQAEAIGKLLENLHESRKAADYKLTKPSAESQRNALLCVNRATRIKDELSDCENQPLLGKIIAGLQAYRAKTGK